jgi:hypothetical protein
MGMILEIVLNNFAIAGKSCSHLFRAIEFTRKQRADFFNLTSDNHGLTRTFSSQLRGLVSLSLVQGHPLSWRVTDPATHGASITAPGCRPKLCRCQLAEDGNVENDAWSRTEISIPM